MTTKKVILIKESLDVISSYTTRLTLRQLYYRLVSRGIISNIMTEYQYLSKTLVDARINGLIPWDAIEDRTRAFDIEPFEYHDPDKYLEYKIDALRDAPARYGLPRLYLQETLVEVWVEKQALQSLFSEVTHELGVTLGICRGYPSITFLHEAAERLAPIVQESEYIEKLVILYFGDYDPSGIDIERNVTERLQETFDIDIEVLRIAILQDQIERYNIPPMLTKTTDARAKKHIAKFGAISSVELDALEPNVLQALIRDSVLTYFDDTYNAERLAIQDDNRRHLKQQVSEILKEK